VFTVTMQKFMVELIDRGEQRMLKIVAEGEAAARRAAMGAAKDMRQAEVREIRPVRIGFAQALEAAA
jgi:hypothetical protein